MKLNSLLVKKSLVAVKLLISYISRVILNKLPNYKLFHALGCNSSKIFILKTEALKLTTSVLHIWDAVYIKWILHSQKE